MRGQRHDAVRGGGTCADGAGLSLSGRNPDTVRRDGVLPRLCGGIYDGNHPGDPLLCVRLRHEFRHPCRWVAGVFHVCHGVGGRAQFDSGSGGYLCAGDGGVGRGCRHHHRPGGLLCGHAFLFPQAQILFPAEGQLPALRPALPQNRPAGDFQLYHPDCHRGGDGGGKQHDCALRAALRLWGGYSPFCCGDCHEGVRHCHRLFRGDCRGRAAHCGLQLRRPQF